ncbi:MAG: hypothetical protein Q4C70_15745, partial [Planctomycetia bacterium]|nr:hypothetical protein [Planctomycetia bacterium]
MSSEETPHHPELPESVLCSPAESPSRSVSVGGWLAQFFYGGIFAFLLLIEFVIPLMLFCCYDYRDYILEFEKVAETGKITSCEDANFSLNDYPVYQVTFEMPSQTET